MRGTGFVPPSNCFCICRPIVSEIILPLQPVDEYQTIGHPRNFIELVGDTMCPEPPLARAVLLWL
jgi:hypothetical protein